MPKGLQGFQKGHPPTSGAFKKGHPPYSGCFEKGHKPYMGAWRGDNVGKDGAHIWVRKRKGRPQCCEWCGTTEKRTYDWANIDHKYRRRIEDYLRMCRPCHRWYDIECNDWKTNKVSTKGKPRRMKYADWFVLKKR